MVWLLPVEKAELARLAAHWRLSLSDTVRRAIREKLAMEVVSDEAGGRGPGRGF